MTLTLTAFDPADHLRSPEAQSAFLAFAFESDDVAHITDALGIVARARGMTSLADATGLTRAGLYKALGKDGDPRLSTLLGVLKALGIHLSVKTDAEASATAA